ncbi:MAG: hypothetical protein E7658_07900 [Ruminococcaceae bacterium]|nr:hypothetical protein [Oscillospiraceae bacterium]
MKNTKSVLLSLFLGVLLLVGCGETTADETDTTETNAIVETVETEPETEAETEPILTPANHEISIEEVRSLLKDNGLQTNSLEDIAQYAYHAGSTMHICRTERGVYTIFLQEFGEESGRARYYIAKIDNEKNVSLLYYGEYGSPYSTPEINIAQDTNGDIVAVAAALDIRTTVIIDAETDEVSAYSNTSKLSSVDCPEDVLEPGSIEPGYSQTLFDFENRKIYSFFNSAIDGYNDGVFDWCTFDMETNTWADGSLYVIMPNVRKQQYLHIFNDGNGGAYIASQGWQEGYKSTDMEAYPADLGSINYFHIPDLTSTETITRVPVYDNFNESGEIQYVSSMGHFGDAYIDDAGYLHITYLVQETSAVEGVTVEANNRFYHTVFNGMEKVFTEDISFMKEKDTSTHWYKPMLTQSTDGTLYLIVCKQKAQPMELDIYKADDALGTTWTLVDSKTLALFANEDFDFTTKFDGSVQDDILSCFVYARRDEANKIYNGSYKGYSVYTFDLSLKDYSITEIVDILADYDLVVDDRLGERAHNTSHQTKLIHTADAAYAAFVYDYHYASSTEYFHVVKIDKDNHVTILYSGSYWTMQNKYMTMRQMPGGEIYICPPVSNKIYILDPATDIVTEQQIAESAFDILQTDILIEPEDGTPHFLFSTGPNGFMFKTSSLKPGTMELRARTKPVAPDIKVNGSYEHLYSLADGKAGAYIVGARSFEYLYWPGSRVLFANTHPQSVLQYMGRTDSYNDSLMLFYMPDVSSTKMQCVEIEAADTEKAAEGITTVVNMESAGDAYVDSEGLLHVFYTVHHFDFDDADRPGNPELIESTFKRYHAVYNGTELVSKEELKIEGLAKTAAVRMAETTDGTDYLLICNLLDGNAKIDVYFETESGWALTQTKDLGEFTAEAFSISSPRGGSVQDNTVDCLVYATDNDVYFTSVTFE